LTSDQRGSHEAASYRTTVGVVEGLLGGWSFAGITTLSSGQLVNLSVMGNPSNTGNPDRPNVLRSWRLGPGERVVPPRQ